MQRALVQKKLAKWTSSMSGIRIFIVITCYNKEKYIGDAIKSAIEEANDVIVVDDCSTDNSLKEINKFPEVISLSLTENSGSSASTYIGVKKAIALGADFVILLDGDDVLAEGSAKYYRGVIEKENVDAIYSTCVRSNEIDMRTSSSRVDPCSDYTIILNPLSTYLSQPKATTALCAKPHLIIEDLVVEAKVQDDQIGLSIHRNSKKLCYASAKTHFASHPVLGQNLCLDVTTNRISRIKSYKANWEKIYTNREFINYQERAKFQVYRLRHSKLFPKYFSLLLIITIPFENILPRWIKHKLILKSCEFI